MHRLILSLLIVGLLAPAANAELSMRNNPPKADGSIYMWVIPFETYVTVQPPLIKNDAVQGLFAQSNKNISGFFTQCPNYHCVRSLIVRNISTQQTLATLNETHAQRLAAIGPFNNVLLHRFITALSQAQPNTLVELEFFHSSTVYPFRATSLEKVVVMPATLAGCANEKLGMTSDVLPADSSDVVQYMAEMVVPTEQSATDKNSLGHNRFYLRAGIDDNDVADGLPPWVEVGMEQELTNGFYWRIKTLNQDISGQLSPFVWGSGDQLDFSVNNCADSAAGIECFALGATEDFEWEVCADNTGETERSCFVFTESFLDTVSIPTSETGPGSLEAVTVADSSCGYEQFIQASSKTSRMHFSNPVYRTSIPSTPSEAGQDPGWISTSPTDSTARCCDQNILFLCEHTTNSTGVIKDQVGVQYELESGATLPTQCLDF